MPFLASLALAAVPCSLAPAVEGPFREFGFDAARAAAEEEEKLVLIAFCGGPGFGCSNLERTTWKDERVLAWLEERAVAVKVDVHAQPALAERYRVGADVTICFVEPSGRERGRLVGYLNAADFLALAPRVSRGISELDAVEEALVERPEELSLRRRRGAILLRAKRHAEALEELLWCYDFTGERDLDERFLRDSWVLSELAGLANVHPPAREALQARARSATEAVLADEDASTAVAELLQLARALDEPQRILHAWDALAGRPGFDDAHAALRDEVVPLLVEAGRHEDALAAAGDVRARLRNAIEEYREHRRYAEQGAPRYIEPETPSQLERRLRRTLRRGEQWLELAAAAGRVDLAQELAAALLELDASPRTYADLARAAAGSGAFALAEDLLAQGFAATPPEEDFLLRAARTRVERLRAKAPSRQADDER